MAPLEAVDDDTNQTEHVKTDPGSQKKHQERRKTAGKRANKKTARGKGAARKSARKKTATRR